jgi:glycosyltransferase involved in cell wall biosynthesis
LEYFSKIKKYPNNNPPKIFCHHGFLTGEKSIKNLILGFEIAANNLAKKNIEIQLVIAGSGECENEYKEIVSNFQNNSNEEISAKRFNFLGNYNYESLPKILEKVDVGVIPYPLNGFNNYTIHNKIFDYWAIGKPVLTSLNKPLIRIIDETKAGIYHDFSTPENAAKAIEIVATSDISEMSQNALEAAENKYNWQQDSKNLVAFLEKFVK